MRSAVERQTALSELLTQISASVGSHLKIIEFVEEFVTRSIEGQVAAIITGTILSVYFDQFVSFEVVVHPVNQSGATSLEEADINIKRGGKIFVAIEVKDKQFSEQDVDHAAFKASQYGLTSITFVIGKSGQCVSSSPKQIAKAILSTRRVDVVFIELVPFVRAILALCPELSFSTFFEKLQYYAISARVKDEVFAHMDGTCLSINTSSAN